MQWSLDIIGCFCALFYVSLLLIVPCNLFPGFSAPPSFHRTATVIAAPLQTFLIKGLISQWFLLTDNQVPIPLSSVIFIPTSKARKRRWDVFKPPPHTHQRKLLPCRSVGVVILVAKRAQSFLMSEIYSSSPLSNSYLIFQMVGTHSSLRLWRKHRYRKSGHLGLSPLRYTFRKN